MAVALRTEVFLVGAFSSAGVAGEIGASLAGSAFAVALGAVLTSATFGVGSAFTAGLSSALASALGAAVLVVVFLVVVVERLRVVVLAAGFASTGVSSTLAAGFAAALVVAAFVVVFAAAFAGALVGFLWYNSFPAQIFMGDTGSLSIGGIIAVFALCIRKELLLPLLCGVFLVESFSVMMQVGYFKYTKRKYGEGRRILLMSPLHHHYQKQGFFETKIVTRFWIVSLLLAAITLVTLKIR